MVRAIRRFGVYAPLFKKTERARSLQKLIRLSNDGSAPKTTFLRPNGRSAQEKSTSLRRGFLCCSPFRGRSHPSLLPIIFIVCRLPNGGDGRRFRKLSFLNSYIFCSTLNVCIDITFKNIRSVVFLPNHVFYCNNFNITTIR